MTVQQLTLDAPASPLRRASRAASLTLLALTVPYLLGSDIPAAAALRTQPLAAVCFLVLLFGLAVAWRHPARGGLIATAAWLALLGVSRGRSALPLAPFLPAAVLALAAAWRERPGPGRR